MCKWPLRRCTTRWRPLQVGLAIVSCGKGGCLQVVFEEVAEEAGRDGNIAGGEQLMPSSFSGIDINASCGGLKNHSMVSTPACCPTIPMQCSRRLRTRCSRRSRTCAPWTTPRASLHFKHVMCLLISRLRWTAPRAEGPQCQAVDCVAFVVGATDGAWTDPCFA